jgi:imidazolonepropionase-like amidohydrolase
MSWVQPVLINVGIALVVGLLVNFGVRALIPYFTRKGFLSRLRRTRTRSREPLLFRQAHLIVGDGNVLNDVDILVEHGNITRIEPARIDAPGARVIEAHGKTVMPGLIDGHCHLNFLNARSGFAARIQARFGLSEPSEELLRFGITSIRTMSEPPKLVLGLRNRTRAGKRVGPTMVVAGPAFTAPGGHPQVTVGRGNAWLGRNMVYTPTTETEARTMVRTLQSRGVDLIKFVYQGGHYAEFGEAINKLPESVALAIIDEAHTQGLPVGAHTHYAADVAFLIEAGVDSIEHGVLEEAAPAELLRAWANKRTFLIPTLSISEVVNNANQQSYLTQAGRNLKHAVTAGVRIAAGTDSMVGAMPADTLHHELQLMVTAGIAPGQAIQAATGNAAEAVATSRPRPHQNR